MKLIKYTLNTNGTVPDYVIDGGYFAVANGGVSPKDWDLVGVANDDSFQTGFANELMKNKRDGIKTTDAVKDLVRMVEQGYVDKDVAAAALEQIAIQKK